MIIVGAGLAGLLAAHAWPQAHILESSERPKEEHKALLRFRSDAVAKLTGIDFRRVTVHKGIWLDGKFIQPNIRAANMYARKVTGSLSGDRSLWNLAPVERYIAPETFYEELVSNVDRRITWGSSFSFEQDARGPVINTAPLPIVVRALDLQSEGGPTFHRAPIKVLRYRVPGADVFQTIYFPWEETALYRASITGSLLIIECMLSQNLPIDPASIGDVVAQAFAINDAELIDEVDQKYGKIIPLPDAQRKALLHELTARHGIFSLGRFATWRNILLDDVVQDIAVLRRLMRASNYDRRLHAS